LPGETSSSISKPLDALPALTILDAINFATTAWNQVTVSVIQSSWARAQILPLTFNHALAEGVETDLESNIGDLIQQLPFECENVTEVREFVDFEEVAKGDTDYCDEEQEEMLLKTIVAAVREEEVEEEEEEKKVEVSFSQAITALDNLVLFCQQQDLGVDIQLYSQLKQLRKQILQKSIAAKKQMRLEDFIDFGDH
jgi:hypothetical protein